MMQTVDNTVDNLLSLKSQKRISLVFMSISKRINFVPHRGLVWASQFDFPSNRVTIPDREQLFREPPQQITLNDLN